MSNTPAAPVEIEERTTTQIHRDLPELPPTGHPYRRAMLVIRDEYARIEHVREIKERKYGIEAVGEYRYRETAASLKSAYVNLLSSSPSPTGGDTGLSEMPKWLQKYIDRYRDYAASRTSQTPNEYDAIVYLADQVEALEKQLSQAAADTERLQDATSALRYIEQVYGRLYGVGWDRVLSPQSPEEG